MGASAVAACVSFCPMIPAVSAHRARSPLHQYLREATRQSHARVDGLFPGGLDRDDTYRRYALGMHRFVSDHEQTAGRPPRLSVLLARDLQALGLPPLPAHGRLSRSRRPADTLGWDYVLAGSALGARALIRDARALGHDAQRGAAFLVHHAASDDWSRVLVRLADQPDPGMHASVAAAAIRAFDHVANCMQRALDTFIPAPTADEEQHES